MERPSKAMAMICIFSTMLTGCYTSTLIEPTGENKGRISSGSIEYLTTREGRKYSFESAPKVLNDSIAGEAKIGYGDSVARHVSIPTSDVRYVSLAELNTPLTVAAIAVPSVVVLGLFLAIRGMDFIGTNPLER